MWRFFLTFILFLPLISGSAQPPTSACVVSGADVPAALVEAQAGPRCLELPAGVYSVTQAAGSWLNATADNLEIRGAGEGKTIIQTTGITLTSSLYVIQLHGKNQHIHDLTIAIGTGYSGASEVGGISIYDEATYPAIERVEVSGGYTGNGSNGFGIGTYRLYTHDQAAQYATIRDCFVHDSPATAIGINSSNNLLLNNRIRNIGTGPLQHGFYAQGGGNLYEGNTVENVSGYAYHGWKKVPNIDGSGDRVIGNLFSGYGSGPAIVSGMPNLSNPALPAGANLTRDAVFTNNIFRGPGVLSVGVPALISGNVLESANVLISAGGDGSRVVDNQFGGLTLVDKAAIQADAPALVQGNAIDLNAYYQGAVKANAVTQIKDNRITRTSNYATGDWIVAISVNADGVDIGGNFVSMNGGQIIGGSHAVAQMRLHDNVLLSTRFVMRDGGYFSGVAYDNHIVGTFNSGALVLRDND